MASAGPYHDREFLSSNLDNQRELSSSLVAAVSSLISGISVSSILQSESLLANGNSRAFSSNSKHSRNSMGTISDIRALEHQTLKVPYELLNKKFRIAQKNIDREASHVQNSINELEKAVTQTQEDNSAPVTIGKINELLIGVVNRLTVLKRKSVDCMAEEIDAVNVCKRRLDHLKEYCNKGNELVADQGAELEPNEPFLANWKRQRMDRMLVDHCLRSGFYETAIELARYSDIEPLTNIDIFLVCRDIEDSLAKHETSRCLSWCHDNRSKLRKVKSTLEFSLRQQDFIELVRSNQRTEAVKYAQKHFITFEEISSHTENPLKLELEQVMGLLACSTDTQVERYKSLLNENRWQRLIEQFRSENFKLYQLSNASIFSITLQAGLSSLKTPQCYRKDGSRNSECPVCSELLNKLAVSLPCAHCSQSRLVCFISGDAMNEHNQPLMLPNGHVYGEKALKKMAAENGGKVICPRTGNIYDLKEAEKVFVM